MATVDVVIPCYNYGRFLEACLRSVLTQPISDLRVLIIDDASTDDSALIAKHLATDDPRIEVRVHSENRGHIRTYNEGIDWAESEYFVLLSADDLLAPGSLGRAVTIMDGEADIVLAYGEGIIWQDDQPFPMIERDYPCNWSRQDLVWEMCNVGANLVTTPTAVGRTVIQKAIGYYNASLPHSADMEMWLRYGACGPVARINAPQAIYRRHVSNMSVAYDNKEERSDFWDRKAAFDSFFGGRDQLSEKQKRAHARSSRAVAEQAFERGADLIRSGIRLSKPARIRHGLRLFRFSISLHPLQIFVFVLTTGAFLRAPGPEGRKWAASMFRQVLGKIPGIH